MPVISSEKNLQQLVSMGMEESMRLAMGQIDAPLATEPCRALS
jgi:hypothetical protein